MPFEMLKKDISVQAESIPVGAGAGRKVLVGINVKSTFTEDETADYEWEIIKKSDGSKIPVEYLGHATKEKGQNHHSRRK